MPSPPSIDSKEASEALQTASSAARRSATAANYARAGRRLIVLGVVWAAVNIAGLLHMPYGAFAWPAAMLVGFVASALLDILAAPGLRGWRHAAEWAAIFLALAVFTMSIPIVAPHPTLVQVETILMLVLGLIYVVIGLSIGWRLVTIGAALMLAVIGGSLWAADQFFLWMAAAGGGGLILGGLWLRKA